MSYSHVHLSQVMAFFRVFHCSHFEMFHFPLVTTHSADSQKPRNYKSWLCNIQNQNNSNELSYDSDTYRCTLKINGRVIAQANHNARYKWSNNNEVRCAQHWSWLHLAEKQELNGNNSVFKSQHPAANFYQ